MSFDLLKSIFQRVRPSIGKPPKQSASSAENDAYQDAVTFAKQGELDRALHIFEAIVARNPQHYLAWIGLGNVYFLRGDYMNAVGQLEKAFALNPSSANLLINYANALRFLGKPELALQPAQKATQLAPQNPDYLTNLGLVYQDLGALDEAERCFTNALQVSPNQLDARFQLAVLNLLRGRFERGWPDYELRLKKYDPPVRTSPYPRWMGQRTGGESVLIYAEQGIGDEIMFASCMNDAMDRADKCILECSPKLAPLFRRSFPNAVVVGGDQMDDVKSISCQTDISFAIPIGSLPLLFRNDPRDFPRHLGYLRTDPRRSAYWKSQLEQLGPGLKIGISWSGGTPKTRGHLRSIPLASWLPLLETTGRQFISLQHGADSKKLDAFFTQTGCRIHFWPGVGDDLDETAGVIENLDLVISVQNTVVHLSGALGRPTWALVPICPEWRYLAFGETMPWYPSVRIFRQTVLGEWNKVFATITALLNAAPP